MWKVRTNIFNTEAIDEQFGELEDPCEKASHISKKCEIAFSLGDEFIVLTDHRHT
jgi:hypothetical protein